MPLPKGIKAALDAWKAGTGEFPTDLDDGVFFPTTGAFDAEVKRKSKGVETQAREAALAKFLGELNLTDESEIAAVKETLEKSGALQTEAGKSKAQLAKLTKDLEDSRKETETFKGKHTELTGKVKDIAKRDALAKYAPQTSSPKLLALALLSDLEVDDEGKVTVKSDPKKSLDELVADAFKADPVLKSPTYKEGTGVKPQPDPKTVDLPYKKPEKDGDKPLTHAQMMMNQLVADGVIANPNAAGASQQ
jgi:hypothetical protein